MKTLVSIVAILVPFVCSPAVLSQSLVADVNTEGSSDPTQGYQFTEYNGFLLFTAVDSLGTELWRTDGTPPGTSMVKDINPGRDSSTPRDLFPYGGYVYFSASEGTNGHELWRSDGTELGTELVEDINPGGDSFPNEFFEYEGWLYFSVDGGAGIGRELYRADNTIGGAQLFWDINFGDPDSSPLDLLVFDSKLVFSATSSGEGRELHYTDGGAQKDTLVDLRPGAQGSFPSDIIAFNGDLFFTADEDGTGRRLYKSDGTSAGTSEFSATRFNCLIVYNNELYCQKFLSPHGLYKTDGIAAPTLLRETPNTIVRGSIFESGGNLFFASSDSLYSSDGTVVGTVSCCDTIFSVGSTRYIGFDGDLYWNPFWFTGPIQGQELSRYEAGETDSAPVLDLVPGDFNEPSGSRGVISEGLGSLLFPGQAYNFGTEPWRYTPPVAEAQQMVSGDGAAAFAGTALTIDFDGSSGSSLVSVEEYDAGVGDVTGIAEGNALLTRWFIREDGDLTFGTTTELRIVWDAINDQGVADPSTIVAYRRDNPGSGTFSSLTTTYEAGPGEIVATGFDSFSEFALATNSSLPVELVDFTAKEDDGSAILSWSTASETDNAGFESQHRERPFGTMSVPRSWRAIEFVEGAGTTAEERSYVYRVAELSPGLHTFRLRQVDFDGTFSYSPVVELAIGLEDGFRLSEAYPNPTQGSTRISLVTPMDERIRVVLFDAQGREVRTLFDGPVSANRLIDVDADLSTLSSGLYFYRAVGELSSASGNLVVVR